MTGSRLRVTILQRLQSGPVSRGQLVAATGGTDNSVGHMLQDMVADGLIGRCASGYQLTGPGTIQAALYESLERGMECLRAHRNFWASHDLSGIPPHLLARIGELEECQLVGETVENHYNCLHYFIEEMSKAKDLCGVSPVLTPEYVRLIDGLLKNDAHISLVLTADVIRAIGRETIARWLHSGVELYEIPAAKVAFAVTENMVSIGLFSPDGHYDPLTDLDCMGEGSVRWGRELYRHYRAMSKKL